MLRIRLRRVGKKKQPSYRIVVAASKAPRDGAFVDQLGHYNPLTDPPSIVLDEEKALKWLREGAQPSDSVRRILEKASLLEKVAES
jgi:small subunit ribosomal protein S16